MVQMKIIAIAVMIATLFLLSCSDPKKQKTPNDAARDKELTRGMCSDLYQADREKIVLLALKYDVPKDAIKHLLADRCVDFFEDREITEETIKGYGEKYGLSPRTTSSILIDYKSMEEKEGGS